MNERLRVQGPDRRVFKLPEVIFGLDKSHPEDDRLVGQTKNMCDTPLVTVNRHYRGQRLRVVRCVLVRPGWQTAQQTRQ